MLRLLILAAACLTLIPRTQPMATGGHFEIQKLADGVYASVRTEPAGLGVDANNLFIIDDEGVVVVDTNFGATSTREVIAALKTITTKSVTRVVNTHWHDDHVLGNQAYRDAYPGVQFIAHAATKEYLPTKGAAARKAQVESLPGFAASLRQSIAEKKNLRGGAITGEELAGFTSDLRMIDAYLKDAPSFDVVLPTIAVTEPLTMKRGQRTIEILPLGRGHTAGDIVLHLPQDGIVATGDLVVAPIPLVGGDQSHVTEWSATLEKIVALRPRIIVPGHGPVIRDMNYVNQMSQLFADITQRTKYAVARGETLDQARKSIDLTDWKTRFAGESSLKMFLFDNYVTGPAITSAYRAIKP